MQAVDPMQQALAKLREDARFSRNITHWRSIPAEPARLQSFPAALSADLQRLLTEKGIAKLYIHQARAVEEAAAGHDFVVVTPTASGKTLCYNLPVLTALLENPEARALYLFPTKALAQDQVHELMQWSEDLGGEIKTYTYDGDTPNDARKAIRSAGSIVVTNPDMLHAGILPYHTKWIRLFENLRYVVIDELHSYRGVFGSHVANVLRRLHRICAFYQARPQFICTSATIANPGEHAQALTGRPVEVIDDNGAPKGPREVIVYNPPVVNQALGIRRSSLLESERIAREFLAQDIQTILFTRSRINTEVLVTYLRRSFHRLGDAAAKIRGYRGGYLPRQRRQIEEDLRSGRVLGVVSTNALELGIDIGSLQAAVLHGYPGTIASTWQQAGRAGRSSELSAVVIVANSSPLNQFMACHPDYLLGRGVEQALINPDNLFILISHVKCAAFELPFHDGECFGADDPGELLAYLAEEQVLRKVKDRWYWMSDSFPAVNVSLRSAAADNFAIIDTTDGRSRVIGEVDRFSAPMLIHDGAIYMHESEQYHIDHLDYERQKAYARQVSVDYYTDANLAVELKVLDVSASQTHGHVTQSWGEVMLLARTHMYKKIRFYTHENIGWGEVTTPEEEMHTTAYWICRAAKPGEDKDMLEQSLLGVANLLANIAPLQLMCEPGDLGVTAQVRSPFTGQPTIFIYERYPGGVGFSEKLYDNHTWLLAQSAEMLADCPCESGCPACIGPIDQPGGKEQAYAFLAEVMSVGSTR